jgi:hypothetical protein
MIALGGQPSVIANNSAVGESSAPSGPIPTLDFPSVGIGPPIKGSGGIGTNLVDASQNLEPPMNTDKHIRERSKSSHSAPATSNHPTPVTAT